MRQTLALPPQSHESFFREVDEEVRRDQLSSFFRKWGKVLGAAALVFLLGVAGWLGWREYRHRQADAQGETLTRAVDLMIAGTPEKAKGDLDTLKASAIVGYRVIGQLGEADLAMARGDSKAAAAIYGAIAADASNPAPYRDLALVRQTAAEYDTLAPKAIVERLRPLAVPGGAWLGSAGEMMAIAYIRLDNYAEAGRLLKAMALDPNVPETIRSRAVQLASGIGVEIDPATLPGPGQSGSSPAPPASADPSSAGPSSAGTPDAAQTQAQTPDQAPASAAMESALAPSGAGQNGQ